MTELSDLDPAEEADLVAFADDCLPPCRRADLEARLAGDPALATALARQRRALALLAGAGPCPSAALLDRVADISARAPRRPGAALVAAVQQLVAPRQRR